MKRHLRRILLCLILGVVTTVGVAWGSALAFRGRLADATFSWVTFSSESAPCWWIEETQVPFGRSIGSWAIRSQDYLQKQHQKALDAPNVEIRTGGLPRWVRLDRQRMDRPGLWKHEGWGWPFVALSYRGFWTPAVQDYGLEVWGGIVIDTGHQNTLKHLVLPCTPVWPGLIGNTLINATILFALMLGFSAARRAARRRRGRCPACGYELHSEFEDGCPECGWRRPVHHRGTRRNAETTRRSVER